MKSARRHVLAALLVAATIGASQPTFAQRTVTVAPYMAVLNTDLKTVSIGKAASLDIAVMDATTMMPVQGLSITASLSMPAMAGMVFDPPTVEPGSKPGHYTVGLTLPHAGEYKLDLSVSGPAGKPVVLTFKITPGGAKEEQTKGMEGMQMKASLGDWPANREGSGTSWKTDSSPMFMKTLPSFGGFEFASMGTIQGGYVQDGGRRGDKGMFSESMLMLMGRKETGGGGALGLHFMVSLDPFINSREGVPNLFQNGFTVNGVDVADRKDPHNVFAELAVSYSRPLSKEWSGFLYGGPVGEPALGNVMYLHRTSGMEVPEAPISHDWFDGTHISFGVATLGLAYRDKWKIEASGFNSAEPGDTLYGVGKFRLNSSSGRVSYNPSRDWSFNASYGYLNAEQTEHRTAYGAEYSRELPKGDSFSATVYLGQNLVNGAATSSAWLAEATYYHRNDAFFARLENVDKDELLGVPPGTYNVTKLLMGDVHNCTTKDGLDYGVGAYVGFYGFPRALDSSYGKRPFTLGVFLRVRPSKMP